MSPMFTKKSGFISLIWLKVSDLLMSVAHEDATKEYVSSFFENVLNLPCLIPLCFSFPPSLVRAWY